MVKHVMIDEGSNEVKEFQFTELEKQTKAYSKEELMRFRQQFQAESIMEKVRFMVTKILIEKADIHSTQNVTPQMVQPQVNAIMSKSIDEILNFLAENGVKLPPPPPPPPKASPPSANPSSPASGQDKLRQMVQQKLLKETDLRGAALANKVDLIMTFERPKILSILQRPIPPPPPARSAPAGAGGQKKPYNWIKECNDYWEYLPPPVQEALKVLGYNQALWNANEQPALSDKAYPDLTPQQQKAVRILGCSPQEWDEVESSSTPPPPPPPAPVVDDKTTTTTTTTTTPKKPISPEERAMMLKIKEMVTYKLRTELGLTGTEPSELLNRAVMEILNLEKEQVEAYLKRPLLPKHIAQQFQPSPPVQRNWVWDSKAYWNQLPPHIRDAAKVLGYDEDTWNNTEQPEESDMKWRHLSIRQQEAATTLGYTQETWDEGDQQVISSDDDDDNDDAEEEESAVQENDSDDESEDFSDDEKESVAKDGEESSDDEEEFIANFIEPEEDDNDGADELIANFISEDPRVVRELSKKDEKDEVLDDDSVDGADIPYVSNSILKKDSSDDEDDDDDDEEFYQNFRNEGKYRSGEVLTEDETESTEEKEKNPQEQKFSSQLETFMSLWSFKL